jgi:putative oxidoreductase
MKSQLIQIAMQYTNYYYRLRTLGQDLLLLVMRLYWGWSFFQTGKGKLINFERTTKFFRSLDIPFPEINVAMAASTEMIGGLLLVVGLGSKIVPIPLIVTMLVAYATAHQTELLGILSDTDSFTEAAPFLFLLTSLIVFLFGPGRLSLDYLLAKRLK